MPLPPIVFSSTPKTIIFFLVLIKLRDFRFWLDFDFLQIIIFNFRETLFLRTRNRLCMTWTTPATSLRAWMSLRMCSRCSTLLYSTGRCIKFYLMCLCCFVFYFLGLLSWGEGGQKKVLFSHSEFLLCFLGGHAKFARTNYLYFNEDDRLLCSFWGLWLLF